MPMWHHSHREHTEALNVSLELSALLYFANPLDVYKVQSMNCSLGYTVCDLGL